MEWNKRLVELRGKDSIEDVAKRFNVSATMYEAYERGDREPPKIVKEAIDRHYREKVFAI